jgi:peptidoglycan/LPS O-acetylase OafA/YrhL
MASVFVLTAMYKWNEFPGVEEARAFLDQVPWAVLFLIDFIHVGAGYQSTPLLSHFWSLAVEEQFYLLWPLVIFLTPLRHIKVMLLGIAAAGPAMRMFIGSDLALAAFPAMDSYPIVRVYFLPFSHIDAFAIGGYFSLYGKSYSERSVLLLAVLTVAAGALSTWLNTRSFYPTAFGFGSHMRVAYQYVWGYTLVNVFFAFLIVNVRDRRFFPRIMENRILDYLGRISYGLYVYHFAAIYFVSNTVPQLPEVIRVALSLGLTVALSAASYELFEKRFTALKDVYFDKSPAGARTTPVRATTPLPVSE